MSYGGGIAEAFGCLMTLVIILGIGLIGFVGYSVFRDDSIKSEHPIKPKIELVIKNNKIDTLYVYRKP